MSKRVLNSSMAVCLSLLFSLALTQCASNSSAKNLPQDILGISVGMDKADVQKRLQEIAQFETDLRKRQQLWKLKNDKRFSHVAVGYDNEDKIRYVTAFVDKAIAKERIRFTDVGDLTKAKKEIVAPHHRYIWEVEARRGKPAYQVVVNGDNADFLTIYSLAKKLDASKSKESEEEEEQD